MARSLGITISRTEISETFPKDAQLIYEHESKPLALIVQDLNHFSNNFIAEQILLALGQNADGQMERGQGLKRLEEFADKIGPANEYEIYDASGLSHENRMSAKLLGQILLAGLVDEQIRPELESSLSVADRNGTLKRRSSGSSEAILRGKTGSLDGVSSLAGVVYRTDGTKLAFVLIQNEVRAKDAAMRLEDTFVRVLARG